MTILLVEDDITLCEILAKMLKFEGIDSIITNDGIGAERILLGPSKPIDLIVCDVMMPKMNGYDLLKHVKNMPQYVDTPFIFITARASKEEELRGLMLGAKAYLKKPIDISTLLKTINEIR